VPPNRTSRTRTERVIVPSVTRRDLLLYLDDHGVETFVAALLDADNVSAVIYFTDPSELERASELLRAHLGIVAVSRLQVGECPILRVTLRPHR